MISQNVKKRLATSFFLIALIILINISNFILVYSLIILGVISIIEFMNLLKKSLKSEFLKICINSFFIFYIFSFCFLFLFFSNFLQLKVFLLTIVLVCAASDIGGFIFGKFFKGPKLTKISPNKTVAGSLGSIFLACLIMMLSIYFFTKNLNYSLILVAIITSIFCQIGDLFFSFLKRKAKLKDTGNFLPGHGGVLDRVDGILLGVPIGFISLVIIF
tara:strand:- start:3151 stop:3801 length:651 start_codon:yes stop_codon:yes gene_type:complete